MTITSRLGRRIRKGPGRGPLVVSLSLLAIAGMGGAAQPTDSAVKPVKVIADLQASCNPEAMQAVASTLTSTTVTVQKTANGVFPTATRFVPAKGALPAYCQVNGSFVTNPKTGKTANFLATFPANWNGKYLQSGCSGHCGQFYVSNPALPTITVTAQGDPDEIIGKGYAHFATDEGHVGMDGGKWAVRKDGTVDQDYVDDFLYRADRVLAGMGKEFTTKFYAKASGSPAKLSRAYFNGCSGGGRDALVVASYFPEKFDGIVGGSPYDIVGVGIQSSAIGLLAAQDPKSVISPAQLAFMDTIVKAKCDDADGVKDGVIQNPAACNFRPERDLPVCTGDTAGEQCFTKSQIHMLSLITSAVTDEKGKVLQPGYTVSELQVGGGPGLSALGDATQKIFVHRNDPSFSIASNYTFREGGPGPVGGFHAVYPASEAAKLKADLALGVGHDVANSDRLMKSRTKMLMWHNFSDEALTPYMSVNYYKALAKKYGGYANLQQKVRLFMIPATAHCSITGNGPNSFDALSAMEYWVERGQAPEALRAKVMARQFTPGAPPAAAMKFPNSTQVLCKFPEMARYSGQGDVKDAANWSCPADDKRLLTLGESGRQAGVSA